MMEDTVDELILLELRQLGCYIPNEVKNLKQNFDVASSILLCLKIINKNAQLPPELSRGIIQRVNQISQLVKIIKNLGYTEPISYHQLLYPNQEDIRRIFLWLRELIPKSALFPNLASRTQLVNRAIHNQLLWLSRGNRLWAPPFIFCSATPSNIIDTLSSLAIQNTNDIIVKEKIDSHSSFVFYPSSCQGILLKHYPYHSQSLVIPPPTSPYIEISHKEDDIDRTDKSNTISLPSAEEKTITDMAKASIRYLTQFLPLVSEQVELKNNLASSLFEYNTLSLFQERNQLQSHYTDGSNIFPVDAFSQLEKTNQTQIQIARILKTALEQIKDPREGQPVKPRPTWPDFGYFREKDNANLSSLVHQYHLHGQCNANYLYEESNTLDSSDLIEVSIEVFETCREQSLAIEAELSHYSSTLSRIGFKLESEQALAINLQHEQDQLAISLAQLDQFEMNQAQLKSVTFQQLKQIATLASEWENYRLPLVENYRRLSHLIHSYQLEMQADIDEIKSIRIAMQSVTEEMANKDVEYNRLLPFYESRPDHRRDYYVALIMDLSMSIQKQDQQIQPIIKDIRQVQKEINQLSGTLHRSLTAMVHLLDDHLENNKEVRDIYMLLASIDDLFTNLIANTNKKRDLDNAILNLQEEISKMQGKISQLDLNAIKNDLHQVQSEKKQGSVTTVQNLKVDQINT